MPNLYDLSSEQDQLVLFDGNCNSKSNDVKDNVELRCSRRYRMLGDFSGKSRPAGAG